MNDVTYALLALGYLPKELPPCFSSSNFADWARKAGRPPQFSKKPPSYLPLTHSLARAGGVRRTLSVPHPDAFRRLCWEVGENWPTLQVHCRKSAFSCSYPIRETDSGRAFVPHRALGDLSLERASNRRIGRYLLVGDISEFYRSLYTHSITWALHSKETAKANRFDKKLLGNRLDDAVMATQDGQTNGIPIGPDTSLVIGEVVLSSVDLRLAQLAPALRGFRYYDDFEFAFSRFGDAERALQQLQEALSDYSLQLNPLKTRIVELPQRLESPWLTEFREFDFRQGKPNSLQRIIRFFDRAFEFHNQHRDSYVLAYAMRRAGSESWSPSEWSVVQDLLLQAVSVEMSSTQQFVAVLLEAQERKRSLDKVAAGEVLNRIVEINAQAGYGSEAAWALWGLLALRLRIGASAAASVARANDAFVALLALDAAQQKLVEGELDVSRWLNVLEPEELEGERWLLSYEAARLGWLKQVKEPSHVKGDPFFSSLMSSQVGFYTPVKPEGMTGKTIQQLQNRRAQSYGSSSGSRDVEEREDDEPEDDEPEDDEPEDDEREDDEPEDDLSGF